MTKILNAQSEIQQRYGASSNIVFNTTVNKFVATHIIALVFILFSVYKRYYTVITKLN